MAVSKANASVKLKQALGQFLATDVVFHERLDALLHGALVHETGNIT